MRAPSFIAALAITVAALAPAVARADDSPGEDPDSTKGVFGVGIIVGEPLGICGKLYLKDDRAIQAAIGSAFIDGGLQLHADYLFHPVVLTTRPSFSLPLYVGPGVRGIQYQGGRGEDNDLALGVRAVVGIAFDFTEVPLDTFVEVAGIGEYRFDDAYGFGLGLNAGAGVRYYF